MGSGLSTNKLNEKVDMNNLTILHHRPEPVISGRSTPTMSSSQFAEILGIEKKEVNRKIRDMFAKEIDGGVFSPSIDSRGYVDEYYLPEVESNMFVAKWDVTHLREVSEFFVNGKRQEADLFRNLSPGARLAIEDLNSQIEKSNARIEHLNDVCEDLAAQLKVGMTIPDFCKMLNGVNIQEVTRTLRNKHFLLADNMVPSKARDEHFRQDYHRDRNKKVRGSKPIVLNKGAKLIYKLYRRGDLIMKKNWNGEYSHINFEV